jgi:hypothetical protein
MSALDNLENSNTHKMIPNAAFYVTFRQSYGNSIFLQGLSEVLTRNFKISKFSLTDGSSHAS